MGKNGAKMSGVIQYTYGSVNQTFEATLENALFIQWARIEIVEALFEIGY